MKYLLTLLLAIWIVRPTIALVNEASGDYKIDIIAEGLDKPYSLAFLPNGDLLVTEKPGRLRVISNGVLQKEVITGVPDVFVGRQGGLLDIALHPRFEQNRMIFLSMTQGDDSGSAINVYRGRYSDGHLSDVERVFTSAPQQVNPVGFGARMVFLPDETLLISVGDGFEYREEAQRLSNTLGKIIRVTDNGQVPQDNPFIGQDNIEPKIWSYGHRVVIGLLHDPVTHTIYSHENGPMGGDELNIIKAGANYGWPIASYGLAYSGAYVSPFKTYPGTEEPLTHWTPSLAPSGLAICRNCQWSEWEGTLFVGMLAGRQVRQVSLKNGVVVEQNELFKELGERIRDVRFGPNGYLYLLTDDSNGRVIKVLPTK